MTSPAKASTFNVVLQRLQAELIEKLRRPNTMTSRMTEVHSTHRPHTGVVESPELLVFLLPQKPGLTTMKKNRQDKRDVNPSFEVFLHVLVSERAL